jgi:hypothetical protein
MLTDAQDRRRSILSLRYRRRWTRIHGIDPLLRRPTTLGYTQREA